MIVHKKLLTGVQTKLKNFYFNMNLPNNWEKIPEYPLGWGLTKHELLEQFPTIKLKSISTTDYIKYRIQLNAFATLSYFQGDCGTLILSGATYCQSKDIELAKQIASAMGFSDIIITLVAHKDTLPELINKFKSYEFKETELNQSNRNPHLTRTIMYYHNPNCDYKGH